jgi:hypothetical protein
MCLLISPSLGHILLTPQHFTDLLHYFCDLARNRTQNQSCRAHQGLQELSRGIFVLVARLGHKMQNTFPDAAVLRN